MELRFSKQSSFKGSWYAVELFVAYYLLVSFTSPATSKYRKSCGYPRQRELKSYWWQSRWRNDELSNSAVGVASSMFTCALLLESNDWYRKPPVVSSIAMGSSTSVCDAAKFVDGAVYIMRFSSHELRPAKSRGDSNTAFVTLLISKASTSRPARIEGWQNFKATCGAAVELPRVD